MRMSTSVQIASESPVGSILTSYIDSSTVTAGKTQICKPITLCTAAGRQLVDLCRKAARAYDVGTEGTEVLANSPINALLHRPLLALFYGMVTTK